MLVHSYKVDGRLVRAEGETGPLVLRASLVDLERSQAASERRLAKIKAQAEAQAAATPPAVRRPVKAPQTLTGASREAIASGHTGGFSAAGGEPRTISPVHGKKPQNEANAGADRTDGARGASLAEWTALFDSIRIDYHAAKSALQRAKDRHDRLVDKHDLETWSRPEREIIRQQLATIREQVAELEDRPAALAAEYAREKERARRAGVLPVAYRKGLGE
jgi:hypothetical protein